MSSLVLVGAPGAGKSTIGPVLAQRLGTDFIDVDSAIEARAKRTITDIFAEDGEGRFRELEETETCHQLDRAGVVALGGGAVTSAAIQSALGDHQVVWLQVSSGIAADRAGLNVARPLLLGNVRGRLRVLLTERLPLYEAVANITVDTDHRDPLEIVDEICRKLADLEDR